MNRVKITSMMLVLIILLGGITTYLSIPAVTAQRPEDVKKAVALKVYERISNHINGLLTLAEENDISIPENLSIKVDLALELLNNASQVLDEDPNLAIKLSIKASIVFGPVARYIMANLPEEVKFNVRNEALRNAIEVKLRLVDRLYLTIEWMENKSIPVPDEIVSKLDEAKSKLEEAKDLVESGEYDVSEVARMIAEASKLIGQVNAGLYRYSGKIWAVAVCVDQSIKIVIRGAYRLGDALNETINILSEDGDIETAKNRTLIIANATLRFMDFISRAYFKAVAKVGSNNYTDALLQLNSTLAEIYPLLIEAANALEDEDILTAITLLQSALDSLMNTLEEISPIFKDLHMKITKLREVLPQFRDYLRSILGRMVINKLASITIHIGKLEAGLKKAYRLYQNGYISDTQMLSVLDKAETNLNTLLNLLNELPMKPMPLINKINSLLDWIQDVRSEIQG
jgi:exonuclease VII small subunit